MKILRIETHGELLYCMLTTLLILALAFYGHASDGEIELFLLVDWMYLSVCIYRGICDRKKETKHE